MRATAPRAFQMTGEWRQTVISVCQLAVLWGNYLYMALQCGHVVAVVGAGGVADAF